MNSVPLNKMAKFRILLILQSTSTSESTFRVWTFEKVEPNRAMEMFTLIYEAPASRRRCPLPLKGYFYSWTQLLKLPHSFVLIFILTAKKDHLIFSLLEIYIPHIHQNGWEEKRRRGEEKERRGEEKTRYILSHFHFTSRVKCLGLRKGWLPLFLIGLK